MGFLDDAIREHLDLKRRRGADPTEVERAEREALGPVRRDPFEHAEDEPQAEFGATEPEGAYDQAEEDYAPAEAAPPPEEEPFSEEGPFAENGALAEEEPFADEEPFAEEHPPAPYPAEGTAVEETVEYDVEGTFEAEHPPPEERGAQREPPAPEEPPPAQEEHPPGEEDVLEETPEFLQDAPEHDRLWFEQKPPRDFDFGE